MSSLVIAVVAALATGDRLPPVVLATPTHVAVTLAPNGRIRVIDFFATWCGPCRASPPALERLRRRFGDRVDLITVDEGEDGSRAAEFLRSLGVDAQHFCVDADGTAFRALGGHRLPTTYVVDGRGVVRRINHGSGPGYEARLARWLTEMLRPPPPPASP